MERVFVNHDGKLYKAEQAKEKKDAEINFPTGDMLKALTSEPMSREDMLMKINHVEFHKEQQALETPKK